jgi:hypothetical protein
LNCTVRQRDLKLLHESFTRGRIYKLIGALNLGQGDAQDSMKGGN